MRPYHLGGSKRLDTPSKTHVPLTDDEIALTERITLTTGDEHNLIRRMLEEIKYYRRFMPDNFDCNKCKHVEREVVTYAEGKVWHVKGCNEGHDALSALKRSNREHYCPYRERSTS